ncbi:unnamed protein product [Polarella glacialis]|uniref:Uncharacterized protein n=1 Tax=Polarella glacialis TaxID=89957 RepID=A0A813IUD4_POLGL|nr:unnamed protein product [Polarella glacialis]
MLSMLLPLESWVSGGAVDKAPMELSLDTSKGQVAKPDPPQKGLPPTAGQLPAAPTKLSPVAEAAPSPGRGLKARVEAALKGGIQLTSGKDLVQMYRDSGLGGGGSMSATAADPEMLKLVLILAGQRLKDLYLEPLRRCGGASGVHFPHLHIDLQQRKAHTLPANVQAAVEMKISTQEKWSSLEKAWVLGARHELTIRYVLAYALVRAKATGRSNAVWIPLGMNTGAQGHANAVCFQSVDGKGAMRVLLYDPNFAAGQEHWVHAKKAVNDSLAGVRQLLDGSGLTIVGQAELFGHGLQTALGTTEQHQGWFSSTVYTTHAGYPICGAVVHFLAVMWLAVTVASCPVGLLEVEAALAEIVAERAGKAAVQGKLAAVLMDLSKGLEKESGFPAFLKSSLDKDKRDWPAEFLRSGGSITCRIPGKQPCTYTW